MEGKLKVSRTPPPDPPDPPTNGGWVTTQIWLDAGYSRSPLEVETDPLEGN